MQRNKIWMLSVLVAFGVSGCGMLPEEDKAELQQSIQELKDTSKEVKQAIDTAKKEVAEELKNINWAEEVFLVADDKEREKLILTRTDLQTQPTVTETKDFIANMKVKEWKKADSLPTDKKPVALYDVGRTFSAELDGHSMEKTLVLANMVVYDGYVQLEILDGMTKYLDFMIPKDAFFVTYEVDADIVKHLISFGA